MEIRNELLDELLKNYKSPEDILGENGLLKQLTKVVLERCMQGEMTHNLGYGQARNKGKAQRQQPKRHFKKDCNWRSGRNTAQSSTGSERDLRAADCAEGADPVQRV